MQYRFVVLNKSMNVVYSAKLDVFSRDSFMDRMKVQLNAFWRYKCQDLDASFRLIPDVDKTLDLFTQNNEPLIF